MKKNKLEDRIVNRVYQMETERTAIYIASRAIIVGLVILVISILASVAYDIFVEQGSFDLINFIDDDIEVFKKYFMDNAGVFLTETPKELLAALVLTITGFVYIMYKIAGNYKRIRNKLVSIYKFYKSKI
jgi:hypothetical protein